MALAVSPGTGDCHQVFSEFVKSILYLVMDGLSPQPESGGDEAFGP